MKASELIKQLQAAIEKYGDLEVGTLSSEYGVYEEVSGVAGKREADRSEHYLDSDDESLGSEFIALR